MNALWLRFFKSAYRREPISGFIAVVGLVDLAIGGIDQNLSLSGFGVSLLGIALALRWWQTQKVREQSESERAQYILPDRSSQSPLPMLKPSQRPSRNQ
jgi:hypothetical protein